MTGDVLAGLKRFALFSQGAGRVIMGKVPKKSGRFMSQLLGSLGGLKKKEIRELERLYQRSIAPDQFISPALAEELCGLALEVKHPLTLLFDKQGRIYQVYVGSVAALGEEMSIKIPQKTLGTCGIRAVTVQLEKMDQPSMAAHTTLLQYRLDSLVTLTATEQPTWSLQFGEHPKSCDAAFISGLTAPPEQDGSLDVKIEGPMTLYQLDKNSFDDYEALVESDMARWQNGHRGTKSGEKAFLIAVAETGAEGRARAEDLLDELSLLAKTAGATIVGRTFQSREGPDPVHYVGKGKAQALAYEVQQKGADLIIADDELSTGQQRTLERILRTRVIDRTELILDIFAQRAQSWEGKIQVELAQLQYLLPRLSGKGLSLSQQTAASTKGGAIATRGPGETKLELDRRRMRTRITELERQAESVRKHRHLQRRERVQSGIPVVALVGYTNAGKSTLLNFLTKSDALAEDKLFATLDPLTRRLVRPDMPSCLLVDTVGFIQKLPTTLVKAFRSTLEEIQSANLILHLVDLSHPDRLNHIEAVQATLVALECESKPQWLLLNKCDRVKQPDAEIQSLAGILADSPYFPLSAKTGEGVETFLEALGGFLAECSAYHPESVPDDDDLSTGVYSHTDA
jgi:GTPase